MAQPQRFTLQIHDYELSLNVYLNGIPIIKNYQYTNWMHHINALNVIICKNYF
jgi:hypothetical protein